MAWDKPNILAGFIVVLGILCYTYFGYFLERTETVQLFSIYAFLFTLSYVLYAKCNLSFQKLLGIAILFRLVMLVMIPNLSQDFYRFIWDGRMLLEGNNPFLSTPQMFLEKGLEPINQSKELIHGMGALNASHFTNYPPWNQLCFLLAALFAKNSILGSAIVLRSLIMLADIGIILVGARLLKAWNLPVKRIFLYGLNPFILMELTGNLHFEGVMLFFLLVGIYYLNKEKLYVSAASFGISIGLKLIPLLFLPLLIRKLKWKKSLFYFAVIGLVLVVSFAPFLEAAFFTNFSNTILLWFQNFEFNASVYYLLRYVGYQISGYNEIAILGKVLSGLVFLTVIILALNKSNKEVDGLILTMLFAMSIYLFLSTTVHPWYIATPVLLCVFTNYRFPVVWSFVVVLSYFAYAQNNFQENYVLLAIEYGIVFGWMGYEVRKRIVNG